MEQQRLPTADADTTARVAPRYWKIIPFIAPNVPRTAEEDHAIRSHASLAAKEAKASKPGQVQFVDFQPNKKRRKRHRTAHLGASKVVSLPRFRTATQKGVGSPSPPIPQYHPFADIASQHVTMPLERLQYLFKSGAFRFAAEPIFETSHVDASMNMLSVFPGCEKDVVFMNALIYAMTLMDSRCQMTHEALLLQGETIRLLNARLTSDAAGDLTPVVGAVMLLRSVAYKSNDSNAYRVHTDGLLRLLRFTASHVTAAARRGMFWLNLFSVLLKLEVCGAIKAPLTTDEPQWPTDYASGPSRKLPGGFAKYRNVIPHHISECTLDTIEMQSLLQSGTLDEIGWRAKSTSLDAMQASIEYRLVRGGTLARYPPIVEGTRLCVFMICFFTWMDTWGITLIPCRVADQLLDMVRETLRPEDENLWLHHTDIMLWFLFVASSVVEQDQGHVPGLRSKRDAVLSETQHKLDALMPDDISSALNHALTSFVYSDRWLDDRNRISAWNMLEASFIRQLCPNNVGFERDELPERSGHVDDGHFRHVNRLEKALIEPNVDGGHRDAVARASRSTSCNARCTQDQGLTDLFI